MLILFTGADVNAISLSISDVADFIPECDGTETNITSCPPRDISAPDSCLNNPGVKCFVNDSSVSLCYADTTMVTDDPTEGTGSTIISEHEGSTQPSPSPTEATTLDSQATTSFLTTPVGVGVIAAVSVVVVVLLLLLVIILVLVCRRSQASKRKHDRISPTSLEGSFKQDGKPTIFTYSGSPGQSRRTTDNVDVPAHHYLEQSPLYEQVKDVAPPSVSSHDSGRSTTASDTNIVTNYSTLQQNEEMPTYSTLERGQADYAQVQPFINNGSLTRGATLQADSEDHYHVLDRSTSQSSNFSSQRTPSTSSSPKPRSKSNVSPKQTRTLLPSITDDPDEIPEYAELSTPVEGNGEVQSTTVPQKVSPELPARHSPGQYRHHSTSLSRRPATHERVSPKILKKSSTLPNTGRTSAGVSPSQRWSGTLDTEHSNGLKTLVEGRLTSSNQEHIPNSSWV